MLYSDLTYNDIRNIAETQVILLPLGATEQHGPHLAVSTDSDIVQQLATAAEKLLPGKLLLCPLLPFGSSDHHLSFGGTISLSPALYTELIIQVVQSLLNNGFRRLILLNGHGGNITPLKQALAILSNRFDRSLQPNIALATYWEMAGKSFFGEAPMESPALSHACEYETSLMLHLFPSKVSMNKVQRAARPVSNGYIPFEDDEAYRGVTLFKQTAFISNNGSSGDPGLATPEKGSFLFEKARTALVEFIESFSRWPLLPDLSESENSL